MNNNSSTNLLFGGKLGWNPEDWTDSDDRVRGGTSQSHLKIEHKQAVFTGHLDIDTLGGAGFASQRTTGDDRHWDLAQYEGIELVFDSSKTDEKVYTFILKDELLPPNPENGREQSTISWEFDFSKKDSQVCHDEHHYNYISIPWDAFKPTYRGKPKADTKPLAKDNVKRVSMMMRSFFGTQKGDFALTLVAIRGIPPHPSSNTTSLRSTWLGDDHSSTCSFDKSAQTQEQQTEQSIWSRFFCWTQKL